MKSPRHPRSLPLILSPFLILSPLAATTLHVPADHPTIQKAIDAASPGDTILVAPGTYKERISLKPYLTLRSAGDDSKGKLGLQRAEVTIIDAGGDLGETPGVSMAEDATFDGFSVTNSGLYDDALWQKHHDSRGEGQSHEHIGGFGAPGIGIDAVSCTVRNNIVHHNGHTGIAIRGAAGKTVAPFVSHNITHRNMGGGIGIMGGALGVIQGNVCFENFYAGIGHSSGASPLVTNNSCYQNIRAGIGISEGASPLVRSNRCYQNRRAGIGIRTGPDTSPTVEDNDCYENGMAGIGVDEGAAPLIKGNRCRDNELAGIGATGGSHPTIVGNTCTGNKTAAIGLESGGRGTALLHGNTLTATSVVAVGIGEGWDVTLTNNQIKGGDALPPAVMVFEGAHALFAKNVISGGGVAGIRVAGSAEIAGNEFQGTAIRKAGPPNSAVWALAGSSVILSSNHMKTWRHALFATGASVTATHNRAEDFHRVAFAVENPNSPASLVANTATSDDPAAAAVSLTGDTQDSSSLGNTLLPSPEPGK